MAEWKLFDGKSEVSTFEYHEHRERAPHLEQPEHRPRLYKARDYLQQAAFAGARTWVDLGCGDGGLLSIAQQLFPLNAAIGYDFAPANSAGWVERGVRAYPVDCFSDAFLDSMPQVDVVSMTEVLEHVADPHGILKRFHDRPIPYVVASSPAFEHSQKHSEEHAWAWDYDGYAKMFQDAGYVIAAHQIVDWSQVLLAMTS